MDSKRQDERDIQHVLDDTAGASVNHFKACYSSHLYTHRSIDLHLGSDLRRYRYNDIPFQTFLRCSFDTDVLKNRVQKITAHKTEDYKVKSANFVNAAGCPEGKTYGCFAEMVLMRKCNAVEEPQLTDDRFCEIVPQFTTCALSLRA